jgi:predicted PurR-regulated permease PerM
MPGFDARLGQRHPAPRSRQLAREALVFWGIGVLMLALVVLARDTAIVLLLTFGGILFGNGLRGAAEWLGPRLRIRIGWSLALCIGVLLALIAAAVFWIEPRVARQVPQLWRGIVQGAQDLLTSLSGSRVGQQVVDALHEAIDWLEHHFSVAVGVLTGLTGTLGAIAYVAFVAIYYAASPLVYRRAVIALVPPAYRQRADVVCATMGTMLQRWLWTRLLSMTALGIATTIGLSLLGIPLASTLGLLSGTFLFVPYIGAIVSAIPALLIAVTVGPYHILYVALLYVAIHAADGYVLTPLLQKRAVDAPPVLVLASQLVFGALWGIVGFTFATPLVGAIIIAVRMLYVDDVLGGDGSRVRS